MKKLLIIATIMVAGVMGFVTTAKADMVKVIDYTEEDGVIDSGGDTVTEDATTTSNEGSSFVSEYQENSDLDSIIHDDGTVEKVDSDSFFDKIYSKLFEGASATQNIAKIIVLIFLVIAVIASVVAWFTNRGKVLWYIIGILICLIAFVLIYYAPEILIAFKNWATN